MEIGPRDIREIAQTIGIIGMLIFTLWQWKKTRETIRIDNYSKIISTLNNLRSIRIQVPSLERALFKKRKKWTNEEIRKRVYGVELASIFEWVFFSHKNGLIGDKEWREWLSMWQRVILAEEPMRKLMEDETIYTFSLEAHKLLKGLMGLRKRGSN